MFLEESKIWTDEGVKEAMLYIAHLANNGVGDSYYPNKIGDPLVVSKIVSMFNKCVTFDYSLKFIGG
jgi:hypothetical protein